MMVVVTAVLRFVCSCISFAQVCYKWIMSDVLGDLTRCVAGALRVLVIIAVKV